MASTRSQGGVLAGELSVRSRKRARPADDEALIHARPADEEAGSPPVITRRYNGTINLYKKWSARPPMAECPAIINKVKFDSGLIQTEEELDVIKDKMRTHGYSGSMGGPGSRVHVPNALHDAATKRAIDFQRSVLVFAVWDRRVRDAEIESVALGSGGVLTVQTKDAGIDRSTIDSTSSQQWVSFAAATLQRQAGSSSWRPLFLGDNGVRDA